MTKGISWLLVLVLMLLPMTALADALPAEADPIPYEETASTVVDPAEVPVDTGEEAYDEVIADEDTDEPVSQDDSAEWEEVSAEDVASEEAPLQDEPVEYAEDSLEVAGEESTEVPSEETDLAVSDALEADELPAVAEAGDDNDFTITGGVLRKYNGAGGDVTIPDGVTYIDSEAFKNCTSVTSVTIPDSVTGIGDDAFAYCTGLTSVTIPGSVTKIGGDVFFGCTSLTSATLSYGIPYLGNGMFFNCASLKSITIPNSVTEIWHDCFGSCDSLESVTIPDSVTEIHEEAFTWCESLTSITIPDGVTTISPGTFEQCDSLTSISIPDSVTYIGYAAFGWCKSLESITIPDGVTDIEEEAFISCERLPSITIPSGVTYIERRTFAQCYRLTSITIPDGVTDIGEEAFRDCFNLRNISIPVSVSTIYEDAFYNNINLRNVYYSGSREDKDKMVIDDSNYELLHAKWHYKTSGIPSAVQAMHLPKIDNHHYVVAVLNEKGDAIEGAEVSFNGTITETNDEGWALFEDPDADEPLIEVSMDGYITWSNLDSNWTRNDKRVSTVILYPESMGALRLSFANYSNKPNMAHCVDLLTTTKKLGLASDSLPSNMDDGEFFIACRGLIPNNVKKYELWQGKHIIESSTSGSFTLNVNQFKKGSGCFIRVFGTDDSHMDNNINLTFENTEVNEDTRFKLDSDSISVSVKDDVPFIGGLNISANLPFESHVSGFLTDSKLMIGLNVKFDDQSKEDQIKKVKDFLSDVKKAKNLSLSLKQRSKLKSFIKEETPFKFFKNGSITLMGYAEGDIGEHTLSGAILVQAKIDAATFENTFLVVVVPIVVQMKIGLEGSVSAEISYDFDTNKMSGNLEAEFAAKLTAFGGVGVSKIAGAGAYGSAELVAASRLLPKPYFKSLDLTGELGLKAYVTLFEYSRAFAHHTWNIYTANSVQSRAARGVAGEETEPELALYSQASREMYSASNYTRVDLSYLSAERDRTGSRRSRSGSGAKATFSTILENTYRNAQPVMVSAGGALYAAFLRADAASGRVYTQIAKCDGTSWTAPVTVSDQNLLDDAPCLLADDSGNLWLAFARTRAGYDDNSLLSTAQNQEIVVGRVDPNTLAFTEERVFGGEGYAHMHQLALVNGKPVLVWVKSTVTTDDSVLWPATNTVMSAAYNNGSWMQEAELYTFDTVVTQMVAGEWNGALSAACVADSDGDYTTVSDSALYVVTGGNAALREESISGRVSCVTLPGATADFVWNDGDTLHTLAGDALQLPGLTSEYTVSGDSIYYSVCTEEGAELCEVKRRNEGWSAPVVLTEGGGYFEHMNVASLNGQDYALGMYATVGIGDNSVTDSKDMVWTRVVPVNDLCIDGYDYEKEGITAGDTIPVSIEVRNAGDHTVTGLEVFLNGESVAMQSVSIPSGETAEIPVNITCPDEITAYRISVLESDKTDYSPKDNEVEVTLGYPDLCVSLDYQVIFNNTIVNAIVSNTGVSTGSAKLSFYNDAGALLGEEVVENLEPGELILCPCDFQWNGIDGNHANVRVELECDQPDLYDHNNNDSVHLIRIERRKISKPEIVLPVALNTIGYEAFCNAHFRSIKVPYGAQRIESRAFAGCVYLEQIEIPATVQSIAVDAFEGVSGFVIYCSEGSYAEEYANIHGIDYEAE